MGWNINVEKNTLRVEHEAIRSLRKVLVDNERYPWYGCIAEITDEGKFVLNHDAMEHMDCFWNEELQEIFRKKGVSGQICFSSSEGDNAGEKWGYAFTCDGVKHLTGKITWE